MQEIKPRFLMPPHPTQHMKIRRQDLPTYEAMGKYVTQRKFNGTHSVIWIHAEDVVLWERRGRPMTLYHLTPGMKRCLLSLDRDLDKELIVVGELLHSKAVSKITNQQAAKDTIVLFDVIYYDNHLTTLNQVDRLELLASLCGNPTKLEAGAFPGATKRAWVVRDDRDSHLWMAETFTKDFSYHFDECCFDQLDKQGRDRYPEIEGLVLRQKDSKLTIGGSGDVNWLVRCRKTKDNVYAF